MRKKSILQLPVHNKKKQVVNLIVWKDEKFINWLSKYNLRKSKKYKNINPFIIPRNHIIENIINDSHNKNFLNLISFNKIFKSVFRIRYCYIFV